MNRRLAGLLAALGLAMVLGGYLRERARVRPGWELPKDSAAEAILRQYLAIEEREQSAAREFWADELEAQRHEDEIIRLWNGLNAATNAWAILGQFPAARIAWPALGTVQVLPHDITRRMGRSGNAEVIGAGEWTRRLAAWAQAGWQWRGSQWALTGHEPASAGRPARSVVRTTVRLEKEAPRERVMIRGRVTIGWRPDLSGAEDVAVDHVEILNRSGAPPFLPWAEVDLASGSDMFNDPLMVRDLDGDGRPDLLLVGAGTFWRNRTGVPDADPPFAREPLPAIPRERIQAAVLADVDGDGIEDLVVAGQNGVRWLPSADGRGSAPVHPGWLAPESLKHPQAIAAGDIDGDGDTDLWVIQYKLPYQQGQFPTPWYDARDGFSSYLLLNDGTGRFSDGTSAAGLNPVRHRRSYSASFVDLDDDQDLDLVNVSDFAGLDVFRNDGRGRFQDVTDALGDARHAFGMAHAIHDANGDGLPDLLMLGMDSTVAERLEMFGLRRTTSGEPPGVVPAMIRGNRLYFGRSGLGQPPLIPDSGRQGGPLTLTGWTWGAAWEDFDLDGRPDLAVANGHETRASAADYERQFWLHDRFVGGSDPNPAAKLYFQTAAGRRQAAGASYGGWQDNQFLLQLDAGEFVEVAWLLGLAVPMDCRNLIAADLDLDGRLDLAMTTQEGWPRPRQRLLVYRNLLKPRGDWIGFRFAGAAPSGTRVTLELPDGSLTRWRVTGDGFRSQSPAAVHFGLGGARPLRARIHWGAGKQDSRVESPAVNQWHAVIVP